MDEEEHLDVLQNIEFAIVQVFRADKTLIDADVQDAMDALVRHYVAEENGRSVPEHRLGGRSVRVFTAVRDACEWRLGRQEVAGFDEAPAPPLAIPELVACLRRIQKSVRLWTQQGGRQGYLDFVSPYIP